MKKNIIHILGFCLLATFFACTEDSFQPIVEVQLPAHTSRLILRADWMAGSDSLAVFVSKSRGVLDKTPYNFNQTYTYWNGKDTIKSVAEYYDTVANAKVELLRNGQLLGTIPYLKKGYHYGKNLFKLDTIAGTVYTIRVSAPNLETVEASQTIQNPFVVLRGGYRKDGAIYTDRFDPFSTPEKGDELNIEFQDNGTEQNYYKLESVNPNRYGDDYALIFRDTLNKVYSSGLYLRGIDPNIEDGFLPDHAFNGKNYVWRFWFSTALEFSNQTTNWSWFVDRAKTGDRVSVKIRLVTKDFILFEKSLDLAYGANDNPFFTEPVILHSNVKNGYGIFTIGRVQTVNFVIP